MTLLTSDQGTLIMGICAAASSTDAFKICFFLVGCAYGFNTFYTATTVYLDSWRNVPDDCKNMVRYMAYSFYIGWLMFPILFIIGPEGAGHITGDGSTIGHAVADLFSKNIWGVLEWRLDTMLNLHLIDALEEEAELEEELEAEAELAGVIKVQPCGKILIVDETSTVSLYFASELGKLGVDVVSCASMLEAHTKLHEALKETEEVFKEMQEEAAENKELPPPEVPKYPFDFIMVSSQMLEHEVVQNARTQYGLPVVAFVEDVDKHSPILSSADDVLPLPVFGKPYRKHQLLVTFCKYCKVQQPVDSKDVIIKELFEAVTVARANEALSPPGSMSGDMSHVSGMIPTMAGMNMLNMGNMESGNISPPSMDMSMPHGSADVSMMHGSIEGPHLMNSGMITPPSNSLMMNNGMMNNGMMNNGMINNDMMNNGMMNNGMMNAQGGNNNQPKSPFAFGNFV
eukprot:CAMPEP_0196579404 /NCGR_PEP_ID=MMETSP1081-20130531/21590_1 /TAXON_ID=36882 /ORGANISM="Pyramimonas amylifera, Strain CCMP720" /LENGTH=456 /DNA_ID=CAMNT_0041898981 /DNA_START=395 /DNA_END=1765 /DNA_ORIENTATION=-